MPEMLKVSELAEPRAERGRVNHETYRAILRQCYTAITETNKRHLKYCRFMIPASMPGRPIYTPAHATFYVKAKLLKGGFTVLQMPPNSQLLHVQWGPPLGKR